MYIYNPSFQVGYKSSVSQARPSWPSARAWRGTRHGCWAQSLRPGRARSTESSGLGAWPPRSTCPAPSSVSGQRRSSRIRDTGPRQSGSWQLPTKTRWEKEAWRGLHYILKSPVAASCGGPSAPGCGCQHSGCMGSPGRTCRATGCLLSCWPPESIC